MNQVENFQRFKSASFRLICVLIVAIIIDLYSNNSYFQGISKTFRNIFYMLGGTFLTANLMSTPIIDFQKSLTPYLPRIFRTDQKLEDCIHRYKRIKPYITKPNTIAKLEKYLREAELYSLSNETYDVTTLDSILTKVHYILTLHEPVPKVKIDIKNVIRQFDDLVIDNKDELITKILVPFILKINGNSPFP